MVTMVTNLARMAPHCNDPISVPPRNIHTASGDETCQGLGGGGEELLHRAEGFS